MIFPNVAVKEIDSEAWSPALVATAGQLKLVSPAANAVVVARTVPLIVSVKCAVTVLSGSICTSALDRDATPAGTVNVWVAVPPGIDSGRPGLPRHIACPSVAGP